MSSIVKVKTTDNYSLFGLYSPADNTNTTLIHIHGTGGSFYWNDFYEPITQSVNLGGLSILATNNRGSGVYELENGMPLTGISLEIFEDCLKDIDAWIDFAVSKGSKKVILEGHSFGISKITYYMAKGKYKDLVERVIFLGTAGVYQTQEKYLKEKGIPSNVYLEEAMSLIKEGNPTALLKDKYALANYYPCSAQTYVNFFTPKSEMFRCTMMARESDGGYRHLIKTPLLWILGNDLSKEYLFVPFGEAFDLIKKENPQVEIHQLECDHGLHGKEEEAAELIAEFLKK